MLVYLMLAYLLFKQQRGDILAFAYFSVHNIHKMATPIRCEPYIRNVLPHTFVGIPLTNYYFDLLF